jgi:chaperone BCS1
MNLADESYKAKIKQSLVEMYIVDEGYWTCFKKTKPIPLDNIILPHEIKNDLITDFDKFINKRDWYSEMGLSFKRGYLLYGAPRNGKSVDEKISDEVFASTGSKSGIFAQPS